MPELKMIPVETIDPPLNPMRIDTLGEGLEELKADLEKRGQLQAIGVLNTGDGRYRLIWGSRRTAAAEEMGWTDIFAKVYVPGEIDEAESMAAENFQRTQLNPIEEGTFYASLIESRKISVAECARRVHKSPATVHRMLALAAGDPDIREALRQGEINAGQAEQLNLVRDEIGRKQGLTWAKAGLMTARQLQGWRENREVTGISDNLESVKEQLANLPHVDFKTMAKCVLHNDYVELLTAPPRVICDECWEIVIDAITALHPPAVTPETLAEREDPF